MLGKVFGKEEKKKQHGNEPMGNEQQVQRGAANHSNPVVGAANAAMGTHVAPQEKWKTTDCQCDGFETCTEDWLCALFFPPAAVALARANTDGSNCFYNLISAPPAFHYNVVRRRYHIIGDDGEDAIMATFCMPCATRKALTESKMRGRIPNWGIYKWAAATQDNSRWVTDLCACSNCSIWCQALIFPCCVAAQARETFDDSKCCFNVFCSTPCAVNTMVRQGYGIEGNEFLDLMGSIILYPCALHRSYQEAFIQWMTAMKQAAQNQAKNLVGKKTGCC